MASEDKLHSLHRVIIASSDIESSNSRSADIILIQDNQLQTDHIFKYQGWHIFPISVKTTLIKTHTPSLIHIIVDMTFNIDAY
ncbi:hypothetical protein QFZ48_005989 [Chitinophaga sp. W2I13]